GDSLFATFSGEIFCLDAATGTVRWHNRLGKLGVGVVSVLPAPTSVAPVSAASPAPTVAQIRRRGARARPEGNGDGCSRGSGGESVAREARPTRRGCSSGDRQGHPRFVRVHHDGWTRRDSFRV